MRTTTNPAKMSRSNFSAWLGTAVLLTLLTFAGAASAQTTSGNSTTGGTYYNAKCDGCHGAPNSATQPQVRNGANAGYVIKAAIQGGMAYSFENTCDGVGDNAFCQTELNDIAAYIATFIADPNPSNRAVTHNTASGPFTIPNVYIGSYASMDHGARTDLASKGSVTFSVSGGSLRATYTPFSGECGADTVSFRAYNAAESVYTNTRSFSVDIGDPAAPNITTSSGTKVGTFNSAITTYSPVNTGGAPYSYAISAGSLPPGLSLNTTTGQITGTPTQGGSYNATLQARNCLGGNYTGQTSTRAIAFTINKASQAALTATINGFTTDRTFTYLTTATATLGSSGGSGTGAVTYASSNTAVCTVSGTTLNLVGGGTCTITATKATDTNYLVASDTIGVTVNPANQAALTALIGGSSAPAAVNYNVPNGTGALTTTGGSGTGTVSYQSNTATICTVSSTTVTYIAAGVCTVQATKAADTNYNQVTDTVSITINGTVPGAPTIGVVTGGNGQAIVNFTAPSNNGGSTISSYTAACTPVSTGTPGSINGATSPIAVTGLTNGSQYNCNVKATNATGTGAASSNVLVTPANVPTFTSANNATRTITVSGTTNITATSAPLPTITLQSGTLPTGLTFTSGGANTGTATITGTPAAGTAATYNLVFNATNNGGTTNVTQNFTLTVNKANQTINFAALGSTPVRPVAFPISATATSGLAVSFFLGGIADGSCSVGTSSVTLIKPGTCTVGATQSGNTSYNAATNVFQNLTITQGTQEISFGAQASRTYSPSGTFNLSPVASSVDTIDHVTSTGLAVSYASLDTDVCTISSTTVTIVGAGTCPIQASQAGNGSYAAATPVTQNISINQATQTISWGAQSNQSFGTGGTFMISPTATGGASGNGIVYGSTTPAVCTVSGTVVTKVMAGLCTLSANQAGDDNYNAATQVTRNLNITASTPSAPTATDITASDAQVFIDFDPPLSNGGAAITNYRATCMPGAITANGTVSPINVTGLTNGVNYTCGVQAQNSAGFGAASNTLMATPILATGIALWTNVCSGCHGDTPSAGRLNAGGTTGTVINYVRSVQPIMLATQSVQRLSLNELAEIAKYINTFVPVISATTAFNTQVTIDVGAHLTLGNVSFETAEVATGSANGTLKSLSNVPFMFTGTQIVYVPNPGFSGIDIFTYQGVKGSAGLLGDPHTVTVTVNPPPAPVVTSAGTFSATFGQLATYQITATNSPTSYGATGLGAGCSINTGSGLISCTPMTTGSFTVTVSATNAGGTGTLMVDVTVSKASQSITFGAQGGQAFSPGGTFMLSPTASATSGLAVTYSSLTTGVCTISSTTVTMVSAGVCTIAANQGGNANYNAALQATQNISISATVPGAPTIGVATAGNTSASIAFTPPTNNGGSPITNYTARCLPGPITATGAASPINVAGLTNLTMYMCDVRATNAVGNGSFSSTASVTPSPNEAAPQIVSANATTFTVLLAGNFVVSATGFPAPTLSLIGTLPTGVTFTPASGALAGTPATNSAGTYPVTITASNTIAGMPQSVMQSFTLTVQKANQTINFAGPSSQPFTVTPITLSATATSGLTVTFASDTTDVCTVSGTQLQLLSTGVCSVTASQVGNGDYNAASSVSRGFTVSQATQTINFPAQTPGSRSFVASSTFAISPTATATSGLTVLYSSTTTSICTVALNTVTMVAPGTCTIATNQSGNANFQAATQVTRNVSLNATAPGAPVIGTATGGNGQATVNFTAPTNNGGSAITGYTATCTPGSISANGSASPIVVSGLTNNVQYSCSVTAQNGIGTSAASATVSVTPLSGQGASIWGSVCNACHTAVPSGNQLNGAGTTHTVLSFVRANQPVMSFSSAVQALTQADLADVALYIESVLPENAPTTPANTPLMINLGSHITLTNQAWSAFTAAEIVAGPTHGSLGTLTGTQVQYTPTPGYVGTDTITYRGKHTGGISYDGDPQTITITVTPAAPVINSSLSTGGVFGQMFTYQVTATNSPTSYGATGLPTGLSISPVSGTISGTLDAAGTYMVTISAANAGGTGNAILVLTVAQQGQTITFPAQVPSSQPFAAGGTFAVSPTATGGASMNPIVYGSLTPSVCTVSGTTVTIVGAGTCTITAGQAGSVNYAAASPVTRDVTITALAPGAPTIGSAIGGNGQATVNFTPPASNGGSAITSYLMTCGAMSNGGSASPITVTGLTNGVQVSCSVTATNSAGLTGPASGTVLVTPASIVFTGVALSRKTHGAAGDFDLSLDTAPAISGAVTVEPRSIGAGHQIVFQFDQTVTLAGTVSVLDAASAPVGSASPMASGNEVIVTVTGIPDNSRATVTLSGVNGSVGAAVSIGFLIGDINNSRAVNATDISGIKARSGQTTDGTNFRFDLNASGGINATDIAAVKARSGLVLP
jgi:mono/diheme cytochrome c family protein